MNVAVVVLDTLRKDAFDQHFEWLPGLEFDNAWSSSHWTVPAHGSMFTGMYPSETGVHAKNVLLDCEQPVLAEQLSVAGYTTRAFSCNPYVSPAFEFSRGFNEFNGSWRLKQFDPDLFDWSGFISETRNQGLSRYAKALYRCFQDDCRTIDSLRQGLRMKLRDWDYLDSIDDDGATEALNYIKETDFGSEEFLYINLMEAHTPYDPPAEYKSVDVTHGPGLEETVFSSGDTPVDDDAIKQAYDDCVRYLSDIYKELFSLLTDQFDYILTVSDHGELLGEHGGWMHGYGLYRELTNIPLSIYGPDVSDGQTDELVSLLDIHATVLDITTDSSSPRGHTLLKEDRQESCLTEYHGFTAQKLAHLRNAVVSEEQISEYDQTLRGIVQSNYYGYETISGFEQSGDERFENGQRMLHHTVEELDIRDPQSTDKNLSKSVRSQLKDLGYA